MKKKISLIFAIYITVFSVISSGLSIKAYAADNPVSRWQGYVEYQKSKDPNYSVDNFLNQSMKQIYWAWGFICSEGIQLNKTIADFVDWTIDNPAQGLPELYVDFWDQFHDEEEAVEKTINEVVKVDPDTGVVKYDPKFTQYINTTINQMMDSCGYFYCYSFNANLSLSTINNGSVANTLKQLIIENQDNYICWSYRGGGSGLINFSACKPENIAFVLNGSDAKIYNPTTWQALSSSDTFPSGSQFTKQIKTDGSTEDRSNGMWTFAWTNQNNSTFNMDQTTPHVVTSGRTILYKMYRNLNSLKEATLGQSPYYISDSYNTNKNISGSYNTNTSNIDNSITYGDIISYEDSFNTTNGRYPSDQDIYNYINNYIPDNGGGGSGGSGGGGSGSGTGIFDFLSELGGVLGNLISNLGQALTNIVRGISELITSIVTDLPTMFFDFIGAFFSWMPDEWVVLLSTALACMLIFGIIKIFRG